MAVAICIVALGTTRGFAQEAPSQANAFSEASWLLTYTWEPNRSGTTVITFNSNGTFRTSQGESGRWVQRPNDGRAFFAYSGLSGAPDWSSVYALTVASDGRSFSGIQGWSHTSGRPRGYHTAVRTAFVEDPTTVARDMLPSDVEASGSAVSQRQDDDNK